MPALKRRPVFKAPLRGVSTDGAIQMIFVKAIFFQREGNPFKH